MIEKCLINGILSKIPLIIRYTTTGRGKFPGKNRRFRILMSEKPLPDIHLPRFSFDIFSYRH
jgi:hypothetical protein